MRPALVQTVLGPIPVDTLGITLMHEHLLLDATTWWHKPVEEHRRHLGEAPLSSAIYGELRMDPFVNVDNCRLSDVQVATEEVAQFRSLGGGTVVDPTCRGIGRALLTSLECWAVDAGIERLVLETGVHQTEALGLYEGSGYGRIPCFGDYAASASSICYEKRLDRRREGEA